MEIKGLINANMALLADAYRRETKGEDILFVDCGYRYFNDMLQSELDEMSKSDIRKCVEYVLNVAGRDVRSIASDYAKNDGENKGRDASNASMIYSMQTVLELVERKYRNCKKISLKDMSIEETIGEIFRQRLELDSSSTYTRPNQLSVWSKIKAVGGTKIKNGQVEARRYFKTLPYRNASFADDIKRLQKSAIECDTTMDDIADMKNIPQDMQAKMCMLLDRQKKFLSKESKLKYAFYEYSQNGYDNPFEFIEHSSMFKSEPVAETETQEIEQQ